MFLKTHLPFEIRGKLSTTPEQAKEMFGYDMKPGAIGIVLQRRNGRIMIRSLMPKKMPPKSTWVKNDKRKFRALISIVRDYNDSLITPVWSKYKGTYSTGFKRFIGINMKVLGNPPHWLKLLLTVGELPKPSISKVMRIGNKVKFTVKNANSMEIGCALFASKELKLYWSAPNKYKDTANIELPFYVPESIKSLIIYVYFKKDDKYSANTAVLAPRGMPNK